MTYFSKTLSFILVGLISISLSAQELSPKVKRLSNRINTVGAVMIGVEAAYLDHRYQEGQFNSINDLYGVNRQDQRYSVNGRNQMSNRNYNISYNKYQFLANQRGSQIRNFRDLTDNASTAELLTLVNHESPTVRCYAFWGLLELQYPKSFDLLWEKLEDYEDVGVFNDDDLVQYKVGDFFILLMTEDHISSDLKKMTEEEKAKLADYLLNAADNRLTHRRDLILDLEPNEANYDKIRELANSTKEATPLALLATFQKDEDLPLINSLFFKGNHYESMKAIRAWPHPDFYPKLVKINKEISERKKGIYINELLMMYQALAQYPTPETKKIMEKSFKVKKRIIRDKHVQYLWLALHKYPNQEFDELFNKIRLDGYAKREALKRLKY